MAKTNFKIDVRWLNPKTCLLLHTRGHLGVKLNEFITIQLLGEIETDFGLKRCGRHKFLL